jgi:hypothetical protein
MVPIIGAMYSIAKIIYGIPLSLDSWSHERTEAIEDAIECEGDGFISYYSGLGSLKPAAFGIEIDSFDACTHHVDIVKLKLTPNGSVLDEFNRIYESLVPELKEGLQIYGNPRVFFLWTTS